MLKKSKIYSRIRQMVVKIQKKMFLMCFDHVALVTSLGQRMYLYDNFSWEFFICLTPFYQG